MNYDLCGAFAVGDKLKQNLHFLDVFEIVDTVHLT